MQTGAITGYIDVAQLALYGFWLFFAGLIYYLRREDKREGYPLVSTRSDHRRLAGFPIAPPPKIFRLQNGAIAMAPRPEVPHRPEAPHPGFDAVPSAAWPGAPMLPSGNAMQSGAGPAAWAARANTPDMTFTQEARVVPLRVAGDYAIDAESPDPIGMDAVGADGVAGGVVTDVWIDRSEVVIRYVEVTMVSGIAVLVPMPLVRIDAKARRVIVRSVMGAQFAGAPILADQDQVTLWEEDRIAAYFASGQLYAEPNRAEPLL